MGLIYRYQWRNVTCSGQFMRKYALWLMVATLTTIFLGCSSTVRIRELSFAAKVTCTEYYESDDSIFIGNDTGNIICVSMNGKPEEYFSEGHNWYIVFLKRIGDKLISVGGNSICIWTIREKRLMRRFSLNDVAEPRPHDHPLFGVDFDASVASMSPNNSFIAVADVHSGDIVVLKYPNMTVVYRKSSGLGKVLSIVFLSENLFVASGLASSILVIDLESKNSNTLQSHIHIPSIKKGKQGDFACYDGHNNIFWLSYKHNSLSERKGTFIDKGSILIRDNESSPLTEVGNTKMSYKPEETYQVIKQLAISPSAGHYIIYFDANVDYYTREGKFLWRRMYEAEVSTVQFLTNQFIIVFTHRN